VLLSLFSFTGLESSPYLHYLRRDHCEMLAFILSLARWDPEVDRAVLAASRTDSSRGELDAEGKVESKKAKVEKQ
jgi:hypothetical protein